MCCEFCLFYKNQSKKESIDLNLLKKILKEARFLNFERIGLTGGEVCIHPKFDELVDLVVKEGFYFGIVSNGYEYERYIPLLKYKEKFDYISFSLDAANVRLQDKLRKKGSFKKVTKAIKFFSQNGIKTHVQMCLNKFNMDQMKKVAVLSEKLGADRVRYLSVIPTEKNKKYILSDEERQDCYKKITQIMNEVKITLLSSSSLHTEKVVDFCRALDLTDMGINPNGELIFCCDIYEGGAILGPLKKESLSDLIKKGYELSNYLKEKRKLNLYTNTFFEGFDSCNFCNVYLRNNKEKNS